MMIRIFFRNKRIIFRIFGLEYDSWDYYEKKRYFRRLMTTTCQFENDKVREN